MPSVARLAAVMPDGRIVAAGGSLYPPLGVLARYGSDGALDPTFGSDGVVEMADLIVALALQPDGRVLVAFRRTLVRFDATGEPDASFGSGGAVEAPFFIRAVARYGDGRIVVAGHRSGPPDDVAVARYHPDGSPDLAFGTDGLATFEAGVQEYVFAVALQADGKILVGGYPAFLARLDASGALDASFGTGGLVAIAETALAVQPDGRIIWGLTRLEPDGSIDPSFGENGSVPGRSASSLALQADGKIVAASGGVWRYLPDGTLDTSFGNGGGVTEKHSFSGAAAVVLQADGRIVAPGTYGQVFSVTRILGGTCGNGAQEAGEQCDDGNTAPGDACDPACCVADADGDGACDPNDPCTGPAPTTGRIAYSGLLRTRYNSGRLSARANLALPGPLSPELDPLANGVRLALEDAEGTLVDLTLPGGAFASPPGFGWKAGATRWTWKGPIGPVLPPGGVYRVRIIRNQAGVRVDVKGRGDFAYITRIAPVPPLALRVVLDPPTAASGQCGELRFVTAACSGSGGGTISCL